MGRTVDVGIRLLGTDVSATRTVKAVSNAFDMLARAGRSALHIMTPLNQGLEVMRKVGRLVDLAIGGAVRAALALRPAGDAAAKAFDALEGSAKNVYAQVGNALIPGLQAFATALSPVLDGVAEWIRKNQDLIADGFLDFLVNLSTFLVDGVAFGLYEVTTAIGKMQQVAAGAAGVWARVKLAWLVAWGTDEEIKAQIELLDELANSFRTSGDTAAGFADRILEAHNRLKGFIATAAAGGLPGGGGGGHGGGGAAGGKSSNLMLGVESQIMGPPPAGLYVPGTSVGEASNSGAIVQSMTGEDAEVREAIKNLYDLRDAMTEVRSTALVVTDVAFDTFWTIATGAKSASEAVKDLLFNLGRMLAQMLVQKTVGFGIDSLFGALGIASTAGPGVGAGVGARTGSAPSPGRLGGGPQQFGGGGGKRPITFNYTTMFGSPAEVDRFMRDVGVPSLVRLGKMPG